MGAYAFASSRRANAYVRFAPPFFRPRLPDLPPSAKPRRAQHRSIRRDRGGTGVSELLAERSGTTLTLTLNRPEKLNALSAPLVEALTEQVKAAEVSGIRLLVLKGNGRNFSAGFDFTDYEAQSEGDLLLRFVRIELLLQALRHARYETMALAH